MEKGIRIDKWLWAVRVFKTRNQASEACRAGKLRIGDQVVKPSREVHPGDLLTLQQPPLTRTLKVVALLENRVGAALVPIYMEDLTPQEEIEKLKLMKHLNFEYRDHGIGRPTKRDRRQIEQLKKLLGD